MKEIEEAKKAGNHQLFEKWRNVDIQKLTHEQENQYLNDTDESKETYDDAWQKYLDRTKQKPEKIREVLTKTEKVFEKPKEKDIEKPVPQRKPSKLIQRLKEQKTRSREDDLTK